MASISNQLRASSVDQLSSVDHVGKVGSVIEAIKPEQVGRIRVAGSYWPARCIRSTSIEPGHNVIVVARKTINLLVEPLD